MTTTRKAPRGRARTKAPCPGPWHLNVAAAEAGAEGGAASAGGSGGGGGATGGSAAATSGSAAGHSANDSGATTGALDAAVVPVELEGPPSRPTHVFVGPTFQLVVSHSL